MNARAITTEDKPEPTLSAYKANNIALADIFQSKNDAFLLDSQAATARRNGNPALFDFNGHTIEYGDKVLCKTASVPEIIASAVTFAWRHKVATMTVDGVAIRRIN